MLLFRGSLTRRGGGTVAFLVWADFPAQPPPAQLMTALAHGWSREAPANLAKWTGARLAQIMQAPLKTSVALLRILKISVFVVVALGMRASADVVIRILAANTSSGNSQSYDPGEGNRIFQGLDPDIALVQEMNYLNNSATNFRAWVDANFGSSFSYFRGATGSIPNGIVSRYPILSSGSWNDTTLTDREFAYAKIDIPGDKNLWAISVHLKASNGSSDLSQRNSQASQLVAYINANIPAVDYLVIGGDFNTYSRSEACVTTLASVFATGSPWPADQAGDGDTNSGRSEPYDWVIPDAELNARKTTLVVGTNSFPNGLVFDSRKYTPLSAVAPILVTDSSSTYPGGSLTNMQHMAVMRAFLIPVNNPPVIAQGTGISRTISQNNYPTAFAASLSATDADGNPLTWSISAAAARGSATITAPVTGSSVVLGYTPANDSLGSDTFTVNVSDGAGGTDTIVVSLTVNPVSAYDAWTFDRFAPLLPATQAGTWGEGANPDYDGYTNFEEFAYGLNPLLADVAVNPLRILSVGNAPVLSFLIRMNGSVPALNYDLQATADPTSTAWVVVAPGTYTQTGETVVNADFRRRTIQLNSNGGQPRMFYRLRITR